MLVMHLISLSPDLLRDAREASGLSQVDAAEKAGVARATLQNAEAGRFTPRADALARMASLYGVTLDSLFVHDEDAIRSSQGGPLTTPTPDLLPSGNSRDDGARAGAR